MEAAGAQAGHSRSPSATGKGTTDALGLSHGHGAIYYRECTTSAARPSGQTRKTNLFPPSPPLPVSRIQRYSSYAFTIFSSVHLATASLIPLATRSVPASESYLLLAREIYQTRVSEPLLVFGPVVAHVAAGVGLRLVRHSQNRRRYGGSQPGRSTWPAVSLIAASGYAFASTLAVHVALNRLLPLAVLGDSSDVGLAYVAHGFARHPALAWLAYAAFLGAAAGHMVWGWARWLGVAQRAKWIRPDRAAPGAVASVPETRALARQRRHLWLVVQGSVLAVFCAWASGGLGVVARGGAVQGWVAKVYDELYDKAFFFL